MENRLLFLIGTRSDRSAFYKDSVERASLPVRLCNTVFRRCVRVSLKPSIEGHDHVPLRLEMEALKEDRERVHLTGFFFFFFRPSRVCLLLLRGRLSNAPPLSGEGELDQLD